MGGCVRSVALALLWAFLYILLLLGYTSRPWCDRVVTATSLFLESCFVLSSRPTLNSEMFYIPSTAIGSTTPEAKKCFNPHVCWT